MKLNSWGLYPKVSSTNYFPRDQHELKQILKNHNESNPCIPYGNGRSYGDSALSKNIICCRKMRYFLAFDEQHGILHCQSGVLLSEIISVVVPKGWFLKVTPGTKYITLGGAIASDVHGKNHHQEGCFSSSVQEFTLMMNDGKIKTCKPGNELFKATCGGMGLTGIILDAKIILKKINSQYIKETIIKTRNLKETFAAFEKYQHFPYSVAWIDCLAKKEHLGKSVLRLGNFAMDGNLQYQTKPAKNIFFTFPSWILNPLSIRLFNWLYYLKAPQTGTTKTVALDAFFYPLDGLQNWNRMYGKNGFTQYQFILPKEHSYEGLEKILQCIAESGKASFLAVLKLYGKANMNYLSFPLEGYSLALDFKITPELFLFLDQLDQIVNSYQGRVYLSKDVRISEKNFSPGYPKLKKFKQFRKQQLYKKFHSLQSKRLEL